MTKEELIEKIENKEDLAGLELFIQIEKSELSKEVPKNFPASFKKEFTTMSGLIISEIRRFFKNYLFVDRRNKTENKVFIYVNFKVWGENCETTTCSSDEIYIFINYFCSAPSYENLYLKIDYENLN